MGGHIYLGDDGNYHYASKNVGGDGDVEKVHDDFAYTAGLRRYYWDVYEDKDGQKLMADNYFTADASRVLLQGAIAGVMNADQTFITNTVQSIGNLIDRLNVGSDGFDGAIGYSRVKYQTGSWVDSKTFGASIAYAKKYATKNGASTAGAFVEYGNGDYDTFSHVYRYGDVYGGGGTKAFGGGLFGAHEFTSRTSLELSVRGGRADNKFTLAKDPWLRHPEVHSYDTGAMYYGSHVGVNHKIPLKNNAMVTLYAQGRYTHVKGDSFMTAFGDPVRLSGTDSIRTRLGTRFGKSNASQTLRAFIGAAWEHEFDGRTKGTLGYDAITDPPSLKGDSFLGELGIQINAGKDTNVGLSAYGYMGNQEGYGVRLGLEHKF
jgi:outer membrane autotransporter protein